MNIREATEYDFEKIWPFFHSIVSEGKTYSYPQNTTKEEGIELWIKKPRKTYVYEENGEILGSYYILTNKLGAGSHVCNCGYMVSPKARGKGVATALCKHSQKTALELGYKAMQFNFVTSSNEGAIRLWTKLGYDIVGRLPKGFNHPTKGFIDALVMYKWLV
ncbi:GNAT family N-acetyltransferase [Flammeovirgaceae bacterium SG7u.111]|nr:GNAT family N-acetyltransferase [Flammeovirgaceae bacterium SG7u.132]WPO34940.1 GNAT family N-acetyltransferase [Flammeovirgaceae bacterium SG7u.111]